MLTKSLRALRRLTTGRCHRPSAPEPVASAWDGIDVTDNGERATPDVLDWGYYAHLSIYHFATRFTASARVLDAGSGTGYGSRYLFDRGAASVVGLDLSEKAVRFATERFGNAGVAYRVDDLCRPAYRPDRPLDVIFSSNAMEHVADPDAAIEYFRSSLGERGTLVLAVPAIASPGILEGNLQNPYHVTNLLPSSWIAKLGRHFHAVQGYRMWVRPEWEDERGWPRDMAAPPQDTRIGVEDFTFSPLSAEELDAQPFNITLVTVATAPRATVLRPRFDESALPPEWRVEEIVERLRRSA